MNFFDIFLGTALVLLFIYATIRLNGPFWFRLPMRLLTFFALMTGILCVATRLGYLTLT